MELGRFYFISPKYFEQFPSATLMINRQVSDGQLHNRPYLLAFSDKEGVYWAVPISSRVDKFKEMYARKVHKYKRCDTIDFCEVLGHTKAILIQNMTPVTDEYIQNTYFDGNKNPIQLAYKDNKRIVRRAKKVLELQRKGYDLIWGKPLEIENELAK